MPRDDHPEGLRGSEKPGQISPAANAELEQSLLVSILFANRVYEQFADILRPHHFSVAVHGRIYEATARLIDRGEQANPITLKLLFDQDGALQDIGGSEYLAR